MSILHSKIISQNLGKGKFIDEETSNNNKAIVKRAAKNTIESSEYIFNWFDADSFFSTQYLTGILKEQYFIVCDKGFLGSDIYSVKKISDQSISTVSEALDSLDEAREFLKGVDNDQVTKNNLKKLGVVSFNKFFSDEYLISYHFFNAENLEVAYYNIDLVQLCGLQVLKNARKWSKKAFNDYSDLQSIDQFLNYKRG